MGLPWLDKHHLVSNNYVTYLNDILTELQQSKVTSLKKPVALPFTANLSYIWKFGGHLLQKKPPFEDCKAKAEK